MKKLYLLGALLLGSIFLSSSAMAAFNTTTLASTTVLTAGITLTATGQIESLITRTNDFDVVLSPGSTLTIYSADKKDFTISSPGATSTITKSCNVNNSTIIFTSPASLSTTTISISGNCPGVVNTVPGAPTAVTASQGDSQAAVYFTAPVSNGGAAITNYTAISIPGSITASAASSPITINGLSNGTMYTFVVTATNSVGTSATSTPSNTVTPVSNSSSGGGSSGGGGGGSIPATPVSTPTTGNTVVTPTNPATVPVVTNTTQSGTSANSTSGGSVTLISQNLSSGSTAMSDIMILQRVLVKEVPNRLSASDIIGIYGAKTIQAVKDLQCKYKIVCSGTPATTGYGSLGTKTRALVNSLLQSGVTVTTTNDSASTNTSTTPVGGQSMLTSSLSSGSKGDQVGVLQRFLFSQGLLLETDIIGIYGPKTLKAVKEFQCKTEIVCSGSPSSTGWGMIGVKTRAKINAY